MEKMRIDLTSEHLPDEARNNKLPPQNGMTVVGGVNYVVELLAWAVKALAMRGANSFEQWMERVSEHFANQFYGVFICFVNCLFDYPDGRNARKSCSWEYTCRQVRNSIGRFAVFNELVITLQF